MLLASLLAFSPLVALGGNPPACKGERAPPIQSAVDHAGWRSIDLSQVEMGVQLRWTQNDIQMDLRRRGSSQLYRVLLTSTLPPGQEDAVSRWICADVGQSSPWFKEEGIQINGILRALDGSFYSYPLSFVFKKREEIFRWEVTMNYTALPFRSHSNGADLLASLAQHWDRIQFYQSEQNANRYKIIVERRRDVKQETDVDLRIVTEFIALK